MKADWRSSSIDLSYEGIGPVRHYVILARKAASVSILAPVLNT